MAMCWRPHWSGPVFQVVAFTNYGFKRFRKVFRKVFKRLRKDYHRGFPAADSSPSPFVLCVYAGRTYSFSPRLVEGGWCQNRASCCMQLRVHGHAQLQKLLQFYT